VLAFADQVRYDPMVFAHLEILDRQTYQFSASEPASDQ
jgi:hypothetical protein